MEKELKMAMWFDGCDPTEEQLENIKSLGYELKNVAIGIAIHTNVLNDIEPFSISYNVACSKLKEVGEKFYNLSKWKDFYVEFGVDTDGLVKGKPDAIFGDMPMVLYPILFRHCIGRKIPFFQYQDDKFLLSGFIPAQ